MPENVTEVAHLVRIIRQRADGAARPFVAALDGRSGAGKSTLAAALAVELDAAVIEGDDFYAGGTQVRADPAAVLAAACIDWTRQRPVLEALRAGQTAVWRAFDWEAFDGRLIDAPVTLAPAPVILLEGVYAARPELADLIDLTAVLCVGDDLRAARLAARQETIGPWERQWHGAEAYYFTHTMPSTAFDIVAGFEADAGKIAGG